MGVEIEFRGVGLFVCENGELTEVIYPNAEVEPPWVEETDPWEHPDHTGATLHYSGIAIQRGGTSHVTHRFIHGRFVRIGDSAGERPSVDASVHGAFPRIDTMWGNAVKLAPSAGGIGATIAVRASGSIAAHHETLNPFYLVGQPCTHLALKLSLDLPEVRVFGIAGGPLRLFEGDRVAFYNYEERRPDFTELYKDRQLPCQPLVTDHDFKWIYSLLRDAGNGSWPPPPLPAPELDCSRVAPQFRTLDAVTKRATVSVSTCFPGLWGE